MLIPDYQVTRLNEMGEWLKINGEAIYKTRPHPFFCEEDKFGHITYYTEGKDNKYTYAIASKLAGNRLILYRAREKEGTEVMLLGHDVELDWFNSSWGLNILFPENLLTHLPCSHAWVFRFEEDKPENDFNQQSE